MRAVVSDRTQALDGWLAAHSLDEATVAWLSDQGLAPLVFYRLRETGLLACLPADVAGSLRAHYYATAAYHALLSAALRDLWVELGQAGIRPIVLKGMALSSTLYLTPAARPTSDLDLLIERTQLPVVREVLLTLGYQDTLGLEPEGHLAFTNHLHVQRESAGGQTVAIEAHWHLVHDPGYVRHVNTDLLRARAQPADLSGCTALVLEPADQLLHACGHLLLHHGQHPRLIWLLDLRLLVERYGPTWDWAALLDAPAMHLAAALCYWLMQAESWFGAFLSEEARQALAAAQPAVDEARYLSAAQDGDLRVWASNWQRGEWGHRPASATDLRGSRSSSRRGPTCSIVTVCAHAGWRRSTMVGGSSAPVWLRFSGQVEPGQGYRAGFGGSCGDVCAAASARTLYRRQVSWLSARVASWTGRILSVRESSPRCTGQSREAGWPLWGLMAA